MGENESRRRACNRNYKEITLIIWSSREFYIVLEEIRILLELISLAWHLMKCLDLSKK